jgi:hypothetical protein
LLNTYSALYFLAVVSTVALYLTTLSLNVFFSVLLQEDPHEAAFDASKDATVETTAKKYKAE